MSAGKTVLIIDDEPAARDVIAKALAEAGLASIEAASGAEGLAAARAHRPAAIILDIIMPHQDGWSVLRELKNDPELCEIPVILATILADRELGLSLGAVEYLTKPIDTERLIRTIEACGNGKRDVLIVDDDQASRDFLRRILDQEELAGSRGERRSARYRTDEAAVTPLGPARPADAGNGRLRDFERDAANSGTAEHSRGRGHLEGPFGERTQLAARPGVAVVTKGANSRSQLVEALERQISARDAVGAGIGHA